MTKMNKQFLRNLATVTAPAALLLLAGCDVDVEDKGKLPDVDVNAQSGQLPEYEVKKTQEGRMPDVDVDVKEGRMPDVDVRGPDIDVTKDTVEVPVPNVDIDLPQENDPRPPAN